MQLVIVRRGKFATFELLARAVADDPNVRVFMDRRVGDRRQTAAPVESDRRRGDRRRRPDVSWDRQPYAVVGTADDGPGQSLVSTVSRLV